jgi:O-antigen ligase
MEAASSGDNNRFRLIWWKTVVQQTLEANPVLGQGFGADLSNDFVRSYYGLDYMDFNTRSPHNFLVTLFGRTGAAGTLAFGAVLLVLLRELGRSIRRVRMAAGRARDDAIALLGGQTAVWIMLIAAFFGVVLEGPMGAVPFWILLGLLHHDARTADAAVDAVTATAPAEVTEETGQRSA